MKSSSLNDVRSVPGRMASNSPGGVLSAVVRKGLLYRSQNPQHALIQTRRTTRGGGPNDVWHNHDESGQKVTYSRRSQPVARMRDPVVGFRVEGRPKRTQKSWTVSEPHHRARCLHAETDLLPLLPREQPPRFPETV